VRKLFVVIAIGSLGVLAGCGGSGGGGGTPVGVPTTITLSPSVGQSIAAGASLNISATVTTGSSNSSSVTWSLSGPGTLSSTTANPVTYTAPSSVTANTPVAVVATSGSGSNYLPLTVLPSGATNTNTVPVVVGAPGPPAPYPDGVFTSVNICAPGTNTCQTVDHVLVDTGSYGLRVLQSVLSPSLSLPDLTDTNSNPIFNCVAFLDGSFLWGPVAEADVRLNGEVAGAALVQVISSSNDTTKIPSTCNNGGTNENTPQTLSANGILGIGGEPTDCELAGANLCDGSLGQIIPAYFSCPGSACSTNSQAITIPENSQIVNPVVLFAADNNGDVITMPALSSPAATSTGTMTFGVGTQSNNGLGSATVLTLDASDSFEVNYAGQTLTSGFIDSGSNGVFFTNFSSPISICSDNPDFFCPSSPMTINPTNTGTNGQLSIVTFTVGNADTLLANAADNAIPDLAGPQNNPMGATACNGGSGDCFFDYGFPFFYGNTVFTAIDGQNTPTETAPWFAYTNPNP